MAAVLQTDFDKAVVQVVEFLKEHWQLHKKFRHQQELLSQLGIQKQNWSFIRSGKRHIPAGQQPAIKQILTTGYQVSPSFLKKNQGPMFTRQAEWLHQKPNPYLTREQYIQELQKENTNLKKQFDLLQQQNATLTQLNHAQKEIIKRMKADNLPVKVAKRVPKTVAQRSKRAS